MESPFPLLEALGYEVGEIAEASSHLLLLLDFDGTLAPIAGSPGLAVAGDDARGPGDAHARRGDCTVGIVSGRSLADVRERVGIEGLIYAGNHGLEISGAGLHFDETTAVGRKKELEILICLLAVRLHHIAGIHLEDKGLTASVHYQHAPALRTGSRSSGSCGRRSPTTTPTTS